PWCHTALRVARRLLTGGADYPGCRSRWKGARCVEMLELVWPALVLVALHAVLGWSLAWLIGLRGLWAVAAAPAFTTTVIGVATTVAGWLGVGWSLVPALVTAAVIAAGILVARRTIGAPPPLRFPPRHRWWTVGTLVVTGLAIAL